MYKIKTSYYYLERGFPENLEPAFTNQSTLRKRFLVERKKKILKRVIRKGLRTLVKPFFSAPTKKGVLLEKSEGFFQDVIAQVKREDWQRKGLVFSSFSHKEKEKSEKITGSILHSREKRSFEDLLRSHVYPQDQQYLLDRSRGGDSLETRAETRKDPARRRRASLTLFLQGKKEKQEISSLQSQNEQEGRKCKRYKFLFPLHRLKGELSKRESQYGKIELYKKQIQERKKLAFFYGAISKNSMKKLVEQARILSSSENPPAKALVTLLECRLDVALFRASFFPSVSMARQWISHNKVMVNQNKIRAPGYQLKGGDCIEISPTCAPLLKEKMRGRIAKILPFRRSRKKVVTPSLVENWCSFERLFTRGSPSMQSKETVSTLREETTSTESKAITSYVKNMKTTSLLHFVEQNSLFDAGLSGFSSHIIKRDEKEKNEKKKDTLSRNPSIKQDKITINPTLMQNFSSIKDHLQSIWEKSLYSRGFFSNFVGEERIKNKSHSHQTLSSFLRTNPPYKAKQLPGSLSLLSRSGASFAKRSDKTDPRRVLDGKHQKARVSTCKINGNLTRMRLLLQKGVILFGRLKNKEVSTLDFLNAKKALIQPRNRAQKLAGLQVSGIKPLHLEVSYKLLTVVFLYSPQKIAYPGNLDFPLIMRSFK